MFTFWLVKLIRLYLLELLSLAMFLFSNDVIYVLFCVVTIAFVAFTEGWMVLLPTS